jgi:hypothetical protein
MQPIDKFGHPIYPKIYSQLVGYSRVLKYHGYIESAKKPNLFFKHMGEAYFFNNKEQWTTPTFFADMRGTSEVPIWSDPSPLFYVTFSGEPPRWLKNRLAGQEFDNLRICRESYEPDLEEYSTQGDNGYCIICGKDFQDEGAYCSKQCENAERNFALPRCQVCGEISDNGLLKHHLNYAEDKTIIICQSCHLKIHRGNNLPELKPVDRRK